MSRARVLLVDDDDSVRFTLTKVMEKHDFEVTATADVPSALKVITSSHYDVLISDLHMPGAADGLTVISAMRHSNPKAITFLLSAFPDLSAAANAILLQADEILVKPMNIPALIELIDQRLASGPTTTRLVESVATILERSIPVMVDDWLRRVEKDPKLMIVPLSSELRIAYVPKILYDVVARLQSIVPLGAEPLESNAAREHGLLRRQQGYSAAMMVRESRMLQVSIFQALQHNLITIDFSVLLNGVMAIADEVDSQLSQAMESYNAESLEDELPD